MRGVHPKGEGPRGSSGLEAGQVWSVLFARSSWGDPNPFCYLVLGESDRFPRRWDLLRLTWVGGGRSVGTVTRVAEGDILRFGERIS